MNSGLQKEQLKLIKKLAFEIYQDTATIGTDYGMPQVAAKAFHIMRHIDEILAVQV